VQFWCNIPKLTAHFVLKDSVQFRAQFSGGTNNEVNLQVCSNIYYYLTLQYNASFLYCGHVMIYCYLNYHKLVNSVDFDVIISYVSFYHSKLLC